MAQGLNQLSVIKLLFKCQRSRIPANYVANIADTSSGPPAGDRQGMFTRPTQLCDEDGAVRGLPRFPGVSTIGMAWRGSLYLCLRFFVYNAVWASIVFAFTSTKKLLVKLLEQ